MDYIKLISENLELVSYGIGITGFIIIGFILKPGKKLKLLPELIPYKMHGKNVRAVLSAEDWKNLAKYKYKESGLRCDICSTKGPLECHEIWSFNDKKLIQKLIGLTTLCPDCHRVKHVGLARKMGWFGDALDHMSKINGISKNKSKKLIEYAEMEVKKRQQEYDLDLTYLNNYQNILPRKYNKQENNNCRQISGNW